MKFFIYKLRGAAALALCMCLCSTSVYAKENVALSAAEQGVKEAVTIVQEEEPLPTLTLEDAVKKAIKHAPSIRQLQDNLYVYEENKPDIEPVTNYDYMKWVDDEVHSKNVSAFTLTTQAKIDTYNTTSMEEVAELNTKNYFASILSAQESLKVQQKNTELQEALYAQGKVKNELGLLSDYNLEPLRIAAEKAKADEETTRNSLEQLYIMLNNLMGEKTDARFEYVYDLEYAPYEMSRSLEQYIADKTKNDPAIKQFELLAEKAKFDKNYLAESDDGSYDAQNEANLNYRNRSLKNAKASMEQNLKNCYLQIQQKESDYATALTNLEKAQLDYRTAQVNHQAGKATAITVQQAELGVLQAEDKLQSLAYEHDVLIYQFEHPATMPMDY